MSQIRLYFSNVRPNDSKFGLFGQADAGAAITKRNGALAEEIATALRRAGYSGGLLVLSTEDDFQAEVEPAAHEH